MQTNATQRAYTVTRNGKEIDTVFAMHSTGFSAQEATDDVRRDLIEHDGYPSDIRVQCEQTGHTSPTEN